MTNLEINSRVKKLYKIFLAIRKSQETTDAKHFENVEDLKLELSKIAGVVGGIAAMNKDNIIKLVAMQSSLRYMQHHTFYIEFAKAAEDLFKK